MVCNLKSQHSNWGNFCSQIGKIFGVKYLSNFIAQTDGFDIQTPKTLVENCYMQVVDDNLKLESPQSSFINNTLIQGNSGAAINLSAYGYTLTGPENSKLTGTFIHRLCQYNTQWPTTNIALISNNTSIFNSTSEYEICMHVYTVSSVGATAHPAWRGGHC